MARSRGSDTSSCSAPSVSQPFTSYGDANWYTLAPGESADNFDGTGWTLRNGAKIKTTQLADGTTGSVLDLPAGAHAISPPTCVESDYPTARTLAQTTGLATVGVGVSYSKPSGGLPLQFSGLIRGGGTGWNLSSPLQVHPGDLPGWQVVRFVFDDIGAGGDAQLYDFYVDPRMN